jgi:hypothetical protein
MQSTDVYFLLAEIKAGIEKMTVMLDDKSQKSSLEEIHDVPGLMKRLNVSKRTIASWKAQGIIEFSQVNGKLWITESKLMEFLNKHTNQPH